MQKIEFIDAIEPPIRPMASFFANVLKVLSATTIAQIGGILATPILTRLFLPDSFGVLATFISITVIPSVIACLRYDLAIMLPDSDEDAANLLFVSMGFTVGVSLLTSLMLWYSGYHLLNWLNTPLLASLLWFAPLSVFIAGVSQALYAWNSRLRKFGHLSIARVINTVTTICLQIGFGLAGMATSVTLVGAYIAGQGISTAVLAGLIWRDDRQIFLRSVRWKLSLANICRYWKFPLVDMWGAILNVVSWQLPTLLFAFFFSQTIVGYHALASRLIYLPMSLIGAALGQVFFPEASGLKGNQQELENLTLIVFRKLVAISLFPALLLVFIGRDVFRVAFGVKWIEAGLYAEILSPWMFFWFISAPLSVLFVIKERQGAALIVHFLIFVSRIGSLYWGGVIGSVYLALALFSCSGAIVYCSMAVWNMLLVNVRLKSLLPIVLQYFLWSVPGIVLIVVCKFMEFHSVSIVSLAMVEVFVYFLFFLISNAYLFSGVKRNFLK